VAEQNLDFNIIAHTQGMEQIANLINRVGALEAETKKLASANTTLTKSTEAVVVNGKRYNNALDAQSKALRNARQGTQQLGMQINDFATSVSTGASPVQAFNQQIGQVGFALSMMGGRLGAVGNFLAGPWGAALLIGTMAVSYLIETLSAGSEAAAKLDVASSSLGEAQSSLGDMFDISTGKIKSNTAETRLNTLAKIANLRVMAAEAQAAADAQFNKTVNPGVFERAKNIGADALGAIYTPGAGILPGVFNEDFVANLEDSRKGAVAFYSVADAAFKELAAGSKAAGAEIENLFKKGDKKFQQYLLDKMKSYSYAKGAELGQQSFDQGVLDSALINPDKTREKKPKVVSEADKLRAAQEAVIAQYESGALSLGEFETKLVAVTDAFQDAQNPAQDWLKQFKEANDNVEKFKKSTNDLTTKALPDYINKLRDLEAQYDGVQKSGKMTSDLQVAYLNAIKATATGPIDTLIKKYEDLHTGMTQFEQDQAAANAVLAALSAENGEASGMGAAAAREAIGRLSKAMDDARIREKNEEIKNSFESIGMAVSDSFKGMITGAMSFKESMKSIIGAVIDQLWKLFVVQKIVGIISGALGAGATAAPGSASGFGNIGMSSPGSFKPVTLRARGGPVTNNTPYMVGERGPELFVPGGNGTIIPNGNMRGGGGGSSFNISVDARGSSDPAAVRAQVQQGILEAAPAIIAAAESRTIAGLRRPRLGGAMQ
jgi:hypothetical protein